MQSSIVIFFNLSNKRERQQHKVDRQILNAQETDISGPQPAAVKVWEMGSVRQTKHTQTHQHYKQQDKWDIVHQGPKYCNCGLADQHLWVRMIR